MLQAFAEYEHRMKAELLRHSVIGVPLGTRLMQIIRRDNEWQLWLSTADYVYGTYYVLHDNGHAVNVTIRRDEGPEEFTMRPSDDFIRSNANGT